MFKSGSRFYDVGAGFKPSFLPTSSQRPFKCKLAGRVSVFRKSRRDTFPPARTDCLPLISMALPEPLRIAILAICGVPVPPGRAWQAMGYSLTDRFGRLQECHSANFEKPFISTAGAAFAEGTIQEYPSVGKNQGFKPAPAAHVRGASITLYL